MRNKIRRALLVLALSLGLNFVGICQSERTLRAIFFNNRAFILDQPNLPITINGGLPVPGHPWYESRIFAVPPEGPPDVNPAIQVVTTIPPSYLFRPPGRVIPSPFDQATFSYNQTDKGGSFIFASEWEQLRTPRDARSTVVLALVNRGRSFLFFTGFDLSYSIDQEVMDEPSGVQTSTIQITPLEPNLALIIRARSESTEQVDVEMLGDQADPPPSSHTPSSVIWNVTNPEVGELLTFTVSAIVSSSAHTTQTRHIPGLLITASPPADMLGTESGERVAFPRESLPPDVENVFYSISKEATWLFEYADRTLVDIREVTELVP